MVVIFMLSGRESVQVADELILNFLFFKTLHVIEYAILFILYFRALKNPAAAFFLTLLYAAIDEIHQMFVPTREGRLRDVIIDGFGGGTAWILIEKWLPRAPKKLRALAKNLEIM